MLEIGSLVDGKYKILRVVGKGGMSVVYQAVNEKANKIWAIKEVRKDGIQNFEVVKQNLIVETDLLKKFNHPNLPSIIDVIDGDGSFLIVMDYIEGNSLSKALETGGAQSQEDVIEWSKQLCDVLGYLHSRKPPVIYRDMKPANVMLKPDGNISLIDFGTAREFKYANVEDTTCLGTQGYAAPEQYGGQGQTDARTDIYCLGATMYHLVTGHNPSTPPYEMYPIRQWNPMLSSGLEEIITKCTQRNPNDRYQSCAELLYALDHYQDLDIENKKVQALKWKTFLTSAILTIVMAISTVVFSISGSMASASAYDNLILQGDNSSDVAEAEKFYKQAIEDVDPSNIEAYNSLLKLYVDDNELSTDEFRTLQTLDNNEDALISKNREAYYDYLMNFATYVFFSNGEGSIEEKASRASRYFKKVASDSSNNTNKQRAQLLYDFADVLYNSSQGKTNISGDTVVDKNSFKQKQWFTIKKLASGDIIDSQNEKIALMCYKTVYHIVSDNAQKYRDYYGITENDINSLFDSITSSLDKIKNSDIADIKQGANDLIQEIETGKKTLYSNSEAG